MPKSINCPICSRKLTTEDNLDKHIAKVHQNKEFYCDNCCYKTNTKDKLRLHCLQHRKFFKLNCNVCGKEYKTNQSMRKHLRTHFQKNQCDYCGLIFSYKRLLVNHISAIHYGVQEVPCKFCTRLFSNTTTRDSHIRLVHKDHQVNTMKYRCPDCPVGFEMREELRIHSFIHFQGEIHHCLHTNCNQIFKKRKLLQIHMKMHEIAGLTCENCDAKFKYPSNLKKHQKKGKCGLENEKNCEIDAELEAKLARRQLIEITKDFSKSVVGREKRGRGRRKNIKSEVRSANVRGLDETEDESEVKNLKIDAIEVRNIKGLKSEVRNLENLKSEVNWLENEVRSSKNADNEVENIENLQNEVRNIKGLKSEVMSSKNLKSEVSCLENEIKNPNDLKIEVNSTKLSQFSLKTPQIPLQHPSTSTKRPYTHRLQKTSSHYQCDLCPFTTLKKSHLLSHMRSKISSTRHKCKHCTDTFPSLIKLHRHSLKVHQKGVFGAIEYSKSSNFCKFCTKFFSAERFTAHLLLHSTPKLQCDKCGVSYRTKTSLENHFNQRHLMTKIDDKKIPCSQCGKKYKKMALKQHEEIHNPIKIYTKCDICGKLMQMKNLKIHIESKHGDRYNEKKCICHCGKKFRYEKQLEKHVEQVHEKISIGKIYRCDECEFSATRLSDLRCHSFEHYGGRVFGCGSCEMKFKTQKLAQIHSKVHLAKELRRFPCGRCLLVFQTSGGRRKHEMKVHEGEGEEFTEIVIV